MEQHKSASERQNANRLRALVQLNLTKGIGPISCRRLIGAFGSPEGVFRSRQSDIAQAGGIDGKVAAEIAAGRDFSKAEAEIGLARAAGVSIVSEEDPSYPAPLHHIADPPILLYLKGSPSPSDTLAIAVVGSRRCSYYGRTQTERLAGQLVARGFCIVSGLARGIDTIAHRTALNSGGRTIAVMGCGLASVYPPENRDLLEEVAKSGAAISEFPMKAFPNATNFPRRNRLISGLSLGVVVVEATAKSGALITAKWALEQGREVFAVPGKADSPTSVGTNRLIKQGAKLVEHIEDILDELGAVAEALPRPEASCKAPNAAVTQGERDLLSLLTEDPKNIEHIIDESGLPASDVSSTLMMLEIKGLVRQLPGKMFVRV